MAGRPRKNPQTAAVTANLADATPDTADEAARAADPEKAQKYVPVIFPLRQNKYRTGFVKSDFVKLFNIDTNANTTAESLGFAFERGAGSREGFQSAGDNSPNTEQVGKTIVGKGTRTELPRGKTVKVALGTATKTGTPRYGQIRVPSSMSAIEIANWIETCFRTNKPKTFTVGRTTYFTDGLAKQIGKLPATKSMRAS